MVIIGRGYISSYLLHIICLVLITRWPSHMLYILQSKSVTSHALQLYTLWVVVTLGVTLCLGAALFHDFVPAVGLMAVANFLALLMAVSRTLL